MSRLLLARFRKHVVERTDHEAVHLTSRNGDVRVTYGELGDAVRCAAADWAGRFQPGEVVLIRFANSPEFIAAILATWACGGVAFPVNPAVPEGELTGLVEQTGVAAVVGSGDWSEQVLRPGAQILPSPRFEAAGGKRAGRSADGDGTAVSRAGLHLVSSGTTGKPKIAFRDGQALDAVAANMVKAVGFGSADRVLMLVPLCHSYGIEHGLLAPLWAGSTVHLCHGLDTRLVQEVLHRERITIWPSVPSVFEMLADTRRDQRLDALRQAYSAGAFLPRSVFDRFLERFGVRIGQLYGSSEVGSVTFNDGHRPGHDPLSVGWGMDGVDVRIVPPGAENVADPLPPMADGEVLVRAPSMLRSYAGGVEVPWCGGYFRTGDLGHLDQQGSLRITGRIKLLIDVGALKVNPLEVEQALASHPGVRECVVVPVAVTETVSRLKAVIVPAGTNGSCDVEELRRFARARLSPHKVPRQFEFRAELPRTAAGKLDRKQVS